MYVRFGTNAIITGRKGFRENFRIIIFSDKKMNKEGFDDLRKEVSEMILKKDFFSLGQVKEKISRIEEEVIEENLSDDVYQEILSSITISMIRSIDHLISCAINYLTQSQ